MLDDFMQKYEEWLLAMNQHELVEEKGKDVVVLITLNQPWCNIPSHHFILAIKNLPLISF